MNFDFARLTSTHSVRNTETPPKGEDYTDENGIRTTVEYTINDDGKKVKASVARAAWRIGCPSLRCSHPP